VIQVQKHNVNPATATPSQVRAWAVVNGFNVPAKGTVPMAATIAFAMAYEPATTKPDVPMFSDAPKGEAPKGEAPKGEAPKGEAPKGEAVKIDARSFVKINGDWHVRTMPGDVKGAEVEVARRNRAATTVRLTADPVVRKIGAQSYAVATWENIKTAAKTASASAVAPAEVKAPEAPATVSEGLTTALNGGPVGHPINVLTVNGNDMWTVTVGTTIRLFTTLAEAAAYAATA
jgi:hypothetical protein